MNMQPTGFEPVTSRGHNLAKTSSDALSYFTLIKVGPIWTKIDLYLLKEYLFADLTM